MARPRTFDETDVLDRAVQVFWSRGFEGTSIADLEDVLDGEGEASATSNVALRRAVERIIG